MEISAIIALGRLVIDLVKLGVSLPAELTAIAKRVQAGEKITDEELDAALEKAKAAQDSWNNA